MMKSIVVFSLLAAVAHADISPAIGTKDQIKAAQDGLLSLMNMGVAAMRTAQQNINEHAFKTGENVGKRLAVDQKSDTHSVHTKLAAANHGLQESVDGGVALLQRGLDEADEVVEDKSVQAKAAAVSAPIRGNSQFSYFNSLLESFGQTADAVVRQATAAAQKNGKGEPLKFLQTAQHGYDEGRKEEQEKLESVVKREASEEQAIAACHKKCQEDPKASKDPGCHMNCPVLSAKKKFGDLKEGVKGRLNTLIQKAGDATKAGMGQAPQLMKEANEAAEEAVKKASE